ncbi:MAG TPA: hypothetical protein VNO81_07440 [Candidatus Nitrosotenuis sp.]|nr:hypothetical protein [Candidatus Nitrosotenuis sp.]
MRRAGYLLLGALWFAGLALTLLVGTLLMAETARGRLAASKHAQAAEAMAVSGVDFASACLRLRGWNGLVRAASRPGRWWRKGPQLGFESPPMGSGRFRLTLEPLPGGRYRLVSVGEAGGQTRRLERVWP